VVVPLALLADPHSSFYVDWYNNLWLVAINGQFLRWHHGFPIVLNTDDLVGVPVPMFYGYLLYPVLGAISSVTGAHAALRLGCLGLVGVEFCALSAAGRAIFRHRGLAYALAVTLVWSVYSLTNLYNRSAVPEFFATGFLTAAVGFVAATLGETRPAAQSRHLWLAALCAALALGSHPPTAVFAAPILSGLALAAALAAVRWEQGRSRAAIFGAAAVGLAALAVAPWFYINLRWARDLAIWGHSGALVYLPGRCDSIWGRLLPFPYDRLGIAAGTSISTPYLEAPIAFGLWVLLAWLVWIWLRGPRLPASDRPAAIARWMLPCALVWLAFLVTLSLWKPLSAVLPQLGPTIQFAYRLVSHCNVALTVAVLAAGLLARGALAVRAGQANVIAAICIAVAAVNVGIKLAHGAAVLGQFGSVEPLLSGRPVVAQVFQEYGTPRRLRELPAAEAARLATAEFIVGKSGPDYGVPAAAQVRLAAPAWVLTNALPFPFARLFANGRRIAGADLARRDERLAVRLPAGETTLTWAWHPDPVWTVLRRIGLLAFGALILGALGFAAGSVRSRRSARR
jgi:hypothetical protein